MRNSNPYTYGGDSYNPGTDNGTGTQIDIVGLWLVDSLWTKVTMDSSGHKSSDTVFYNMETEAVDNMVGGVLSFTATGIKYSTTKEGITGGTISYSIYGSSLYSTISNLTLVEQLSISGSILKMSGVWSPIAGVTIEHRYWVHKINTAPPIAGATIRDINGNAYTTVKIGTQEWTVENLRTTKYNDGTAIPFIINDSIWDSIGYTKTGAYCYYNNTTNADSIKKFGALYNWYAVDTKKLAPIGWHVPSDADWDTLKNYLIVNRYNWDGTDSVNKIAKSMAAKTDWHNGYTTLGTIGCDLSSNNRSGFTALPNGCRDTNGTFNGGLSCYLWSTTEYDTIYASNRRLILYSSFYKGKAQSLIREPYKKASGFSVRLVRD
jgi:uncharacterized protein (TIGR02145 family)